MKKVESKIVILILVLLNLWLLYNNNHKNKVIEELGVKIGKAEWGYENTDNVLLYLSHEEVQTPSDEVNLVVFFSDQGCQSCIKDEVSFLNTFNEKSPHRFEAYLLTQKAPTYLSRMFDANFEYKVINPLLNVFDSDFEFVNPIAVLVDSTGLVHRIHKAEVGNNRKSEEFYDQMREFFDTANPRNEHGR